MNSFQERLVYARDLRKMTQQELANASGVKQSAIGNYESGLRKSSREVVALARVLRVRAEWLQYGRGPMEEGGLPIGEPGVGYDALPAWPFKDIDAEKVRALPARDLAKLEAAILLAADTVGVDVAR